jgi:hypothetical protein
MTPQALSILDLRDIAVPDAVGFWPPSPFVWVLLGAAGVGVVMLIWRAIVRWRAAAYRREGLARLSRIETRLSTAGGESAALRELSVLLKRVALAAFPRRQVAPLYGEAWLRFLDETCHGCAFSTGPGHLLSAATGAASMMPPIDAGESGQLIRQARVWIKGHRSP